MCWDVLSDLREQYRQGYVSFQYISISFFVPIIFLHTLSSSILTLLVGDAESLWFAVAVVCHCITLFFEPLLPLFFRLLFKGRVCEAWLFWWGGTAGPAVLLGLIDAFLGRVRNVLDAAWAWCDSGGGWCWKCDGGGWDWVISANVKCLLVGEIVSANSGGGKCPRNVLVCNTSHLPVFFNADFRGWGGTLITVLVGGGGGTKSCKDLRLGGGVIIRQFGSLGRRSMYDMLDMPTPSKLRFLRCVSWSDKL